MTPIGETLRRERLKRSLDLEQISRELKISPRFLEAIEQEKFDRLPGNVFAKSFVRQYARMLGLDEEDMAAEVQRQLEPQPQVSQSSQVSHSRVFADPDIRMPRLAQWETVGDNKASWGASLPALALVVLVMLGCAGLYTWWQRYRHATPPVQTVQAVRAVRPAPAVTTEPAVPNSADRAAAPPAQTGSADAPAETGETATPTQAGMPVPPVASPVQVQLVAQEPVWVRVESDGKFLYSATLQPNERRTVDASREVRLRLGNAGGITILLNGKPIGPLGANGRILTLQFTPGGFKTVSASNPAVFDPF